MNRRTLLGAAGSAALLPALPRLARAQPAWPDRPLRMIVPYPPGGGTDVVARELAQRLTAATGWNVVVENRPGAGGNIGIDAVATARDGHTIGLGQTSNLAINPTLYPTIPYQPLRDLSLISLVASQPNVLVVAKASPMKTLSDLVRTAKARPGALTAGHPGSGTVGHLSVEMFIRRAEIDIVIVPYRGAGQVMTDLMADRIQLYSANPLAVRGMLESGDMRALSVTSAARLPTLPEVPTIAESGYPGFEAVNWTGVVGPASMPPAVVARLNAEIGKALALPAMRDRLTTEGSTPRPSSPEEFRVFLTSEIEKWGQVVREGKVQAD